MRNPTMMLMLLIACSDPADPSPDAGEPGEEIEEIEWLSCPLRSDGAGADAECAEIDVAARHGDASSGSITLFVKRLRAAGEAQRQLWLLNGGPGGPGADFEPLVELLATRSSDTDFYMLDHRGTGRSSRLGCPAEDDGSPGGIAVTEAETPACIDVLEETWGDRLAAFTTTEAAHDLAWLIDHTREDEDVQVMGGSYGTFWAQRYLQLYPAQPTAVTLMGIATPTISFVDYDARFDRVGNEYLAACGADAGCAARLGPDPAARGREIFDRIEDGHCAAAGLDRAILRQVFAGLIFFSWDERVLVPAVLHRLDRCRPRDVTALQNFAEVVLSPRPITIYDRLQAPLLGLHIGLSELWTEPSPPLDELLEVIEGATFSTELAARFGPRRQDWPRYQPDELDGRWAEFSGPMLLINGTLDPATTIELAEEVAGHFERDLVAVPGGTHSWLAPLPGGGSCSLGLFAEFLADPSARLDTSCVDQIVPLEFGDYPELAAGVFGTSDIWDNEPGDRRSGAAAAERLRAGLDAARRQLGGTVPWTRSER
jgi:pimeloyl-ACP methyl ester carboxylesterase